MHQDVHAGHSNGFRGRSPKGATSNTAAPASLLERLPADTTLWLTPLPASTRSQASNPLQHQPARFFTPTARSPLPGAAGLTTTLGQPPLPGSTAECELFARPAASLSTWHHPSGHRISSRSLCDSCSLSSRTVTEVKTDLNSSDVSSHFWLCDLEQITKLFGNYFLIYQVG